MATRRSTHRVKPMVDIFTYTKNVAKSAIYSAEDIMKEKTPATASFLSTNKELLGELYDTARDFRTFGKRMQQYVTSSRVYEAATEGAKALVEDISSGTFYNKERIARFETRALGSMANFDDGFDESAWDTGDMSGDSDDWDFGDFGDGDEPSPNDDVVAAVHLSSKDNAQAVAGITAKVGANIAASNRANTMLMLNQQIKSNTIMEKGFTSIFDRMGEQNARINAIMETNSAKALEYYDKSLTLLQDQNNMIKEMLDITKKQAGMIEKTEQEKKSGKIGYDDVVTAEGVPDLKKYFQSVKSKAFSALPTELRMIFGNDLGSEDANNLLAWVASPLQGLSNMITQTLIPKMVTNTMEEFDKTISGSFSGIMARFNKMAIDDDASPIMQYIGKVFGLKPKSADNVNTANYEKGQVPFDGITRKAIIEVIPGYLRRIESALTGEGERVYSYGNGRWTRGKDLKKQYDDISKNAYRGAYGDVKDEMMELILSSGKFSRSDMKTVQDNVDRFLTNVVTNDWGNPRELMSKKIKDAREDNYKYGVDSQDLMELITTAYKFSSRGTRSQLARNAFDARETIANRLNSLMKDNQEMLELLNGSDIDAGYTWAKDGGKRTRAPGHLYNNTIDKILDDKGHNLFFYLQHITRELITFRENHYGRDISSGGGGPAMPATTVAVSVGTSDAAPAQPIVLQQIPTGHSFGRGRPVYRETQPINLVYDGAIDNASESHRQAQREYQQRLREQEELERYRQRPNALTVWDGEDASAAQIRARIRENSIRRYGDINHIRTTNWDNLYEYRKRSQTYNEYYMANRTLLDEYFDEQREERRARGEKLDEDYGRRRQHDDGVDTADTKKKRATNSLIDKLLAAETLADKFDVFNNGLDEALEAPGKYLSTILMKADERLYSLIFGDEKLLDANGKPVKGIMDAMVVGIQNTFGKVNDWMDEKIFKPLKEKLGIETFGDAVQKFFGLFGVDFNATREGFVDWLFKDNGFVKQVVQQTKDSFEGLTGAVSGQASHNKPKSKNNVGKDVVAKFNANRAKYSEANYAGQMDAIATFGRALGLDVDDDLAFLTEARDMYTAAAHNSFDELAGTEYGQRFIEQYASSNNINLNKMRRNERLREESRILDKFNSQVQSKNDAVGKALAGMNATQRQEILAILKDPNYLRDFEKRMMLYTQYNDVRDFHKAKNSRLGVYKAPLAAANKYLSQDARTFVGDYSAENLSKIIDKIRNASSATTENELAEANIELQRIFSLLSKEEQDQFSTIDADGNRTIFGEFTDGNRRDTNKLESFLAFALNAATAEDNQFYEGLTDIIRNAGFTGLQGLKGKALYDAINNEHEFIKNSARGTRLVTRTGLTTIHKGEAVIPSEYVPQWLNGQRPGAISKNKEIADELSVKNRFLKSLGNKIGMAAEGNMTTAGESGKSSKLKAIDVPGQMKSLGKLITDTAYKSGYGAEYESVKSGFEKYAAPGIGGGLVGGATGIGASMLFGLAGGPIIGAAVGAAANIARNSDTFSEFLFGKKTGDAYENGKVKREGGFFSREFQDAWQQYFPTMSKAGLGGAALGLLTPLGPVGGLMIGSALGFAKENADFQGFLFGEEGLFREEDKEKLKKALPATLTGTAVGALALSGPFGLLGGALVGTLGGFATTTETFKRILLGREEPTGKYDKDGNPIMKRHGGVVGMISSFTIDPIKNGAIELKNAMSDFIKKDIVAPLKDAVKPIGNMIKNAFNGLHDGILKHINNFLEKRLGVPVEDFVHDKILDPMGRFAKGVLTFPLKLAGGLVSAPFKALGFVGNNIRANQIKKGTDLGSTAQERLEWRANHKIRTKKIFGFGGVDGYKTADEWINSASDADIQSLIGSLGALENAGKADYEFVQEKKKDLAGTVNQFFDDKKHGGFFTQDNNARKRILTLLEDPSLSQDKLDEAFRLIRTLKGRDGKPLSDDKVEELITRINDQVRDFRIAKSARGKGANHIKVIQEKLKDLGFNDGALKPTDITKVRRMLESERSGRRKNGAWVLDAEAQAQIDAGTANTQTVVSAIREIGQVLVNIHNAAIEGKPLKGEMAYGENVSSTTARRLNRANVKQDEHSGVNVDRKDYKLAGSEEAIAIVAGGRNAVKSHFAKFNLGEFSDKINSNDPEEVRRAKLLAKHCLTYDRTNPGIGTEAMAYAIKLDKKFYDKVLAFAEAGLFPMSVTFAKALVGTSSATWGVIKKLLNKLDKTDWIRLAGGSREKDFLELLKVLSRNLANKRLVHIAQIYVENKNGVAFDMSFEEFINFNAEFNTAAAQGERVKQAAYGMGTKHGDVLATVSKNELIVSPNDIRGYAEGNPTFRDILRDAGSQISNSNFAARFKAANNIFRGKGVWTLAADTETDFDSSIYGLDISRARGKNAADIKNMKAWIKARLKSLKRKGHDPLTSEELNVLNKRLRPGDTPKYTKKSDINSRALDSKELEVLRDHYQKKIDAIETKLDAKTDSMESEQRQKYNRTADVAAGRITAEAVRRKGLDMMDLDEFEVQSSASAGVFDRVLRGDRVMGRRLSSNDRQKAHTLIQDYLSQKKAIGSGDLTEEEKDIASDKMNSTLTNIEKLLSYDLSNDGDTIKKLIDKNGEVYVDKLDPKNKAALQEGRVNNRIHDILDRMDEKIGAVKGFFTDKVDGERSRLDIFTDNAKNIAKYVLAGVATAGGLSALFQTIAPNVTNGIAKWWEDSGKQTAINVANGAEKWLTEDLPETATNVWNTATGAIGDFSQMMWDNISVIGPALGQGLVNVLNFGLQLLPGVFSGAWSGLKTVTGLDSDVSTGHTGEAHFLGTGIEAILRGSKGTGLKKFTVNLPTVGGRLISKPLNLATTGAGYVVDGLGTLPRAVGRARVQTNRIDNALSSINGIGKSAHLFNTDFTKNGRGLLPKWANKLYKADGTIDTAFVDRLKRQYGSGAVEQIMGEGLDNVDNLTRAALRGANTATVKTTNKMVKAAAVDALHTTYKDQSKNLTEKAAKKLIKEDGLSNVLTNMNTKQYKKTMFNIITDTTTDTAIETVADTAGKLSKTKVGGWIVEQLTKLVQKMKKPLASYIGEAAVNSKLSTKAIKSIGSKLIEYLADKVANGIARMASSIASAGVLDIVFAITDLTGPILFDANAMEILGITQKPTFGQKVIAGIMNCILGLPFMAYGLIPPSVVSWILFDVIGIDFAGIKDARTQSKAEYEAFKAKYDVQELSFEEYSYMMGNHTVGIVDGISSAIGGGEEGLLKRLNEARAKEGKTALKMTDFKTWDSTYDQLEASGDLPATNAASTGTTSEVITDTSVSIGTQILNSLNTLVAYMTGRDPSTISANQYVTGISQDSQFIQDSTSQYEAIVTQLMEINGYSREDAERYASTLYGTGTGRYSQKDKSINMRFNKPGDTIYQDINTSGCGPIAATNLINRHLRYGMGLINPQDAAEYALRGGYKERNGGTDPRYFNSYFKKNGISSVITSDKNQMRQAIKNGQQVVLMGSDKKYGMGSTPYGPNPHYVVATGFDGDNIIIDNPEENNEYTKYNARDTINKSSKAIITNSRYGMGTNVDERAEIMQKMASLASNDVRLRTYEWLPAEYSYDIHGNNNLDNNRIEKLTNHVVPGYHLIGSHILGNDDYYLHLLEGIYKNLSKEDKKSLPEITTILQNYFSNNISGKLAEIKEAAPKLGKTFYDLTSYLNYDAISAQADPNVDPSNVIFDTLYSMDMNGAYKNKSFYDYGSALTRYLLATARVNLLEKIHAGFYDTMYSVINGGQYLNKDLYTKDMQKAMFLSLHNMIAANKNSASDFNKSLIEDYLFDGETLFNDSRFYESIAAHSGDWIRDAGGFFSLPRYLFNKITSIALDHTTTDANGNPVVSNRQYDQNEFSKLFVINNNEDTGYNIINDYALGGDHYTNEMHHKDFDYNKKMTYGGDMPEYLTPALYKTLLFNKVFEYFTDNDFLQSLGDGSNLGAAIAILRTKYLHYDRQNNPTFDDSHAGYNLAQSYAKILKGTFDDNYNTTSASPKLHLANLEPYIARLANILNTDKFNFEDFYKDYSDTNNLSKIFNTEVFSKVSYSGPNEDQWGNITIDNHFKNVLTRLIETYGLAFTGSDAKAISDPGHLYTSTDIDQINQLKTLLPSLVIKNNGIESNLTIGDIVADRSRTNPAFNTFRSFMTIPSRLYTRANNANRTIYLNKNDGSFADIVRHDTVTHNAGYKTTYYDKKTNTSVSINDYIQATLPQIISNLNNALYSGEDDINEAISLYDTSQDTIPVSLHISEKDAFDIATYNNASKWYDKFDELTPLQQYWVIASELRSERKNKLTKFELGGAIRHAIAQNALVDPEIFKYFYLNPMSYSDLLQEDPTTGELSATKINSKISSILSNGNISQIRDDSKIVELINPILFKSGKDILNYVDNSLIAGLPSEKRNTQSYRDAYGYMQGIKRLAKAYSGNPSLVWQSLMDIMNVTARDYYGESLTEPSRYVGKSLYTEFKALRDNYLILGKGRPAEAKVYDKFLDYLNTGNLMAMWNKNGSPTNEDTSDTTSSGGNKITSGIPGEDFGECGGVIDGSYLANVTELSELMHRDFTYFSMPSANAIRQYMAISYKAGGYTNQSDWLLYKYADKIKSLAAKYNIDPRVALAIMRTEFGLGCNGNANNHIAKSNYISIMRAPKNGETVGASTMIDFSTGEKRTVGEVDFTFNKVDDPRSDGVEVGLEVVFRFLKKVSVEKRHQRSLFMLNFKPGNVFCGTFAWITTMQTCMEDWNGIDPSTKVRYVYPSNEALNYYRTLTGTALDTSLIPTGETTEDFSLTGMLLKLAKSVFGEDVWNFFSGGLFGNNANKMTAGQKVMSYVNRAYSNLSDVFTGLMTSPRYPATQSWGKFGPRYFTPDAVNGISGGVNQHFGVDIADNSDPNAPIGSPVWGEVVSTETGRSYEDGSGYGNNVIIRDENGRLHLFGHLSRVDVKPGDWVDQGNQIGLMGSTGSSDGEHLHYGVNVPYPNDTIDYNHYHISEKDNINAAFNDANKNTSMSSVTPFSDLVRSSQNKFANTGWVNPERYLDEYLANHEGLVDDGTGETTTPNSNSTWVNPYGLTNEEMAEATKGITEADYDKYYGVNFDWDVGLKNPQARSAFFASHKDILYDRYKQYAENKAKTGQGSGRTSIADQMILGDMKKHGVGGGYKISDRQQAQIKNNIRASNNKMQASLKNAINNKHGVGGSDDTIITSKTDEKLLQVNASQTELLATISNTLKSIEETSKQNNALMVAFMEAVAKGEISTDSDTFKSFMKALNNNPTTSSGDAGMTGALVDAMLNIARQ